MEKYTVERVDSPESDLEAEDIVKPVSLIKLFRYATAFDLLLISVAILMAVVHGAALPGSLIIFTNTVQLFGNQATTGGFYVDFNSLIRRAFEPFELVEGEGLTIQTALLTGTIDEGLVDTEDELFELFSTIITTSGRIRNLSCLVYRYSLETNTTILHVLNQTVNNVSIPVTADGCSCVQDIFSLDQSDFVCTHKERFFFGAVTGDGILWQVYYALMLFVVVLVAGYVQVFFMQWASERQVHKIRILYYKSVLRQDIGWFDMIPGGSLASRLNGDIEKIHDGIGDRFSIFIQAVTTFIVGVAVTIQFSWELTLVIVIFIPLMSGSVIISSLIIALFTGKEQKAYASAGAVAEEAMLAIRTVAAFSGEQKEFEKYKFHLSTAWRLALKKGLLVGIGYFFTYFFVFVVVGTVLWVGASFIMIDRITIARMLAVFFSAMLSAFAIVLAAPNLQSLVIALGSAGVVYSIIDRNPPIDSTTDEGEVPDELTPSIQFNNVSFSYPANPDTEIFSNFSLDVSVGQTVALVGPSGSGKSTVVQLIQRFYDTNEGKVLIGGHDVRSLNLRWLRKNIGVVSQEPVLFDTSIAENIRYGREDASMEDIEKAAREANAYDFISELPEGFNTQVGGRGAQLSGGQKQRIAIARALVRNPKILLLDEATSALDNESERIVQEALDKAREGRTTIIIAHRLSTIQKADMICSIVKGKLMEMGSHSELLDKQGLYYELVTAQTKGNVDAMCLLKDPTKAGPRQNTGTIRRKTTRKFSREKSKRRASRRKSSLQLVRTISQLSGPTAPDSSITSERKVVVHRQLSRGYTSQTITVEEELTEDQLENTQSQWDKDVPSVPLTRVFSYSKKEWWLITLGIIGSILVGMSFPVFGLLYQFSLDVFYTDVTDTDGLVARVSPWAGGFIGLAFIMGSANFLKSVCLSLAGERLTTRLRLLSFSNILRQDMGWFDLDRNSVGLLSLHLSQDAARVQGLFGNRLIETIMGLVLFTIVAFVTSWSTSVLVLLLSPLLILVAVLRVYVVITSSSVIKGSLEKSGKLAVDSIINIRTVASLGLEKQFLAMFQAQLLKPYRKSTLNAAINGIAFSLNFAMLILGFAVLFGVGAVQVIQDESSVFFTDFTGLFVVFVAFVFGVLVAGQTSTFLPEYLRAKQSANRIFALLNNASNIDSSSDDGRKIDDGKFVGTIALKDVKFNYPSRPSVEVLQGLSVSVKPGQTLALVGPSGCGKSTVVSLVERFYDPLAGLLTLDGSDLKDLSIRWLRSQIGIVSQEPVLFDASIADNIRYGANFREVSDEEVVEAAKAANIHSFIETLPQGYSTNAGAQGTKLSGGQKQRIAIARALVRNPKILLLDEATSALDTESERIVQEALDKAREGRTTIVIAHRLSTICNSDSIAVINKGKVAEIGTHSELIEKRGVYYHLNNFQNKE